ncbi:MAG: GTPase Era [Magnetococcales bacterium]|nr:GTPase Era [Magnetococcales bacterium]
MANSGGAVYRSGWIAIVGRPNMGKSTFLNQVLGQRAAIVTPKAQTTRTRIVGIRHQPDGQMIFLDTPGIHPHHDHALNRIMVQSAYSACDDADVILYFVAAGSGVTVEDWEILARLSSRRAVLFLVINKVDSRPRPTLLPLVATCAAEAKRRGLAIAEFAMLSALTGENVAPLLATVFARLPKGPPYFPAEQWTDQPERFLAAEIVREKLFLHLQQELPYHVAVQVEGFAEGDGRLDITARVLVDRTAHKGIVIGRKGEMLKRIGTAARLDLERFFSCHVFLGLQVVVRKGWRGDTRLLHALGYAEGEDDRAVS